MIQYGRSTFITLALLLSPFLSACNESQPTRDLADVIERDTLVVAMRFNSTSYLIYRGEPMGYEYELLREFAEEQGVEMKVELARTDEEIYDQLLTGAADIGAARLIPTRSERERVAFTTPIYLARPTLVQQTGESPELPQPVDSLLDREVEVNVRRIGSIEELAGRTVHIPEGSPYGSILAELHDTVSGDIEVVELDADLAPEDLIRGIAGGDLELTVAASNVARLSTAHFTNVSARPTVGRPHNVAFAVAPDAPQLLDRLNEWIAAQHAEGTTHELYQKYFLDRRGYQERTRSDYLTTETGRLSEYDDLLKRHAPEIGWDWRLLAAQTFQESRFDPDARSWAGATGLLQLMPATAAEHGVTNARDPEDNVRGAISFIRWLQERWTGRVPEEEVLKFVLASYNTGAGHVEDAQRLAEKHGDDPRRWDDVAYWLLQKSKREVYTDPVVRFGFARGLEPVTYVALILDRFEHYREFVQS